MKKILVILDGASGLSHKDLNGKTAFDFAYTPNLDYFSEKGKMGYMYPLNEKTIPGSDNSIISLLGNNPEKVGRGILEAVGAGLEIKKGDLCLRTNFGTIDNLKNKKVLDRRAGRTLTSKEAKALGKEINEKVNIDCNFEFKSTVQHRGILVLRGNFSDKISNIDNEWGNKKSDYLKFSKALDNKKLSKATSDIVNEIVEESFVILNNSKINSKRIKKGLFPANIIFTRGPSNNIPKLKKYENWMSINSMPLEIGIARLSGMDNYSFNYPIMKDIDVYKTLYKGLNKSIRFAIKILKRNFKNYEGCYIQFKETDIPGHDNKPLDKKEMIELLDRKFFSYLRKISKKENLKIVVSCDHSTPCKLKSHSADPVPVLVYPGDDKTKRFTEKESKKGSLGKIYGKEFMKKTGLDK